ncbi:hypothetical protein Mboo_1349 [Methanoregula boonei 6A8]|jgi:hypothetical protein|uniref:Uncharacterized protein n=1 Tax=Methanoregula boonei (strain DSM 21154 / JCM 14090 / 6A8) TaxID=456442 RepID=A7I806_METB6|nr:hypothetical protein [Methanoregula boonei]ABS55867.1 hypothetical protein Mboo_1349 [Methanoregula boonei 6A8]
MDKKDITYIIAAFFIILVIAFVIKPLATGQPVNTGLSFTTTVPPTSPPLVTYTNITTITTAPTTSPPTPVPTWNQKIQTIGFVNPSNYGISSNQSLPQGRPINATLPDNNFTVYATITGTAGGTTQIVNIPFPYWELSYTITQAASPAAVSSFQITPTFGSGASISGVQGSFSTVQPQFSIQVMDATDPNRIVRTITPPGGIDFNLWSGTAYAVPAVTVTTFAKYATISPTPTASNTDPRPWLEKFYEGGRGYYFIINSQNIGSYTLKILIPSRYIGKY